MRSFLNHADSCRYGSILYYYATVRKYRVEHYWHQRAVHLLAALDHQTGCVLSQTRVDCKTNEAKAVFDLFKTLVLKGKAIIGDAMCCQRDICEETVDSDGDYFFTVKENQPTLLKEIQLAFAETEGFSPLATTRNGSGRKEASTLCKGHGRVEHRRLITTTMLNEHFDWPGMKRACKIIRTTTHKLPVARRETSTHKNLKQQVKRDEVR